jgi:hypothetical protein
MGVQQYDGQSKAPRIPLLIAFFDIDGLMHHEFVPPGQSVTGYFYVQVLLRLHDEVQRKWHKWQGQWFLHHNNAPSHTSLVVQQFLAEKNIPVITQLLFSLDLAPSYFWLFPTLKMGFMETHFPTMEVHQIDCDGQTPEDSKEAFRWCFK